MDLDKKIGIKENLIAEVGEQEAERIWDTRSFPNIPGQSQEKWTPDSGMYFIRKRKVRTGWILQSVLTTAILQNWELRN